MTIWVPQSFVIAKLDITRDKIKESNSRLIQSTNAEWTIVETLEAMKIGDERMESECIAKLEKLINTLQTENKRTAFNTYGFHRIAKLYFFAGVITKKREYIYEALRMLRNKYDFIPDLLICESMHAFSTRLLISGYLRETKISGYFMDALAIRLLVVKYCPVEDPYKNQMAKIYRECASLYADSLDNKCNFEILSFGYQVVQSRELTGNPSTNSDYVNSSPIPSEQSNKSKMKCFVIIILIVGILALITAIISGRIIIIVPKLHDSSSSSIQESIADSYTMSDEYITAQAAKICRRRGLRDCDEYETMINETISNHKQEI